MSSARCKKRERYPRDISKNPEQNEAAEPHSRHHLSNQNFGKDSSLAESGKAECADIDQKDDGDRIHPHSRDHVGVQQGIQGSDGTATRAVQVEERLRRTGRNEWIPAWIENDDRENAAEYCNSGSNPGTYVNHVRSRTQFRL